MAAQIPEKEAVRWKEGTLCELFNRERREWVEGEVVGTFTDEKGEWIKVRSGQQIRNVLDDDPDLRKRSKDLVTFPAHQVNELQTNIAGTECERLLQWMLKSSGHKIKGQSTRLVIHIFCSFIISNYWILSQSMSNDMNTQNM